MWKHFISGYLNFTKRERNGVLILLSFICFFLLLPFAFPYFIQQKDYDHSAFEKAIASLQLKQVDSSTEFKKRVYTSYDRSGYTAHNYGKVNKGELFYFDPNSTTTADWQRLGIRDKTIATIQKYLSKGGKFYKKADIGKIWGLHKDEVERLLPYVQIKENVVSAYPAEKIVGKKVYKSAAIAPVTIEINTADTSAFTALPGIGRKLSQRIINFRDKLGGFYTVEQIGETFGLPDSTFQKIKTYLKISRGDVKQFNINKATVDEMKTHPYLRYNLANAIVQYRNQHGNYTTISDIKKIMSVTDEIFNKLAPYLAVQ